jgi:hypothetical protein
MAPLVQHGATGVVLSLMAPSITTPPSLAPISHAPGALSPPSRRLRPGPCRRRPAESGQAPPRRRRPRKLRPRRRRRQEQLACHLTDISQPCDGTGVSRCTAAAKPVLVLFCASCGWQAVLYKGPLPPENSGRPGCRIACIPVSVLQSVLYQC